MEECPNGFLSLATTEAIIASTGKTGYFESWARIVDDLLRVLPVVPMVLSG